MATQYLPGLNLAEAVASAASWSAPGCGGWSGTWGRPCRRWPPPTSYTGISPSNVILSLQGAHVIDFGIAQAADSSAITSTGSRVGTPAFMSPEYLREGRCDTASDVFSLAGSLIYAATGHAPSGTERAST
ncbi:protein kinase domain-containing protein [Streptomyces sp. Marseille-Q5077]|uniref:protein kinase domain-containing protein n=1 Tax=Streptomyces sp. Marseille-Q5077 TaxID=3418995 RepID=UPI003D01EB0E